MDNFFQNKKPYFVFHPKRPMKAVKRPICMGHVCIQFKRGLFLNAAFDRNKSYQNDKDVGRNLYDSGQYKIDINISGQVD
jgi:hypothetical protein